MASSDVVEANQIPSGAGSAPQSQLLHFCRRFLSMGSKNHSGSGNHNLLEVCVVKRKH